MVVSQSTSVSVAVLSAVAAAGSVLTVVDTALMLGMRRPPTVAVVRATLYLPIAMDSSSLGIGSFIVHV